MLIKKTTTTEVVKDKDGNIVKEITTVVEEFRNNYTLTQTPFNTPLQDSWWWQIPVTCSNEPDLR